MSAISGKSANSDLKNLSITLHKIPENMPEGLVRKELDMCKIRTKCWRKLNMLHPEEAQQASSLEIC